MVAQPERGGKKPQWTVRKRKTQQSGGRREFEIQLFGGNHHEKHATHENERERLTSASSAPRPEAATKGDTRQRRRTADEFSSMDETLESPSA
ncbi:MAG: hypothetical protein ACREH8_05170, partial [Opitutaceae bacterium]